MISRTIKTHMKADPVLVELNRQFMAREITLDECISAKAEHNSMMGYNF